MQYIQIRPRVEIQFRKARRDQLVRAQVFHGLVLVPEFRVRRILQYAEQDIQRIHLQIAQDHIQAHGRTAVDDTEDRILVHKACLRHRVVHIGRTQGRRAEPDVHKQVRKGHPGRQVEIRVDNVVRHKLAVEIRQARAADPVYPEADARQPAEQLYVQHVLAYMQQAEARPVARQGVFVDGRSAAGRLYRKEAHAAVQVIRGINGKRLPKSEGVCFLYVLAVAAGVLLAAVADSAFQRSGVSYYFMVYVVQRAERVDYPGKGSAKVVVHGR